MNLRNQRKSRVQAPCCGRYRYRYQLEHDGSGNYYCDRCWAATPPAAVLAEAPSAADFAAPGGDALLPARDIRNLKLRALKAYAERHRVKISFNMGGRGGRTPDTHPLGDEHRTHREACRQSRPRALRRASQESKKHHFDEV